MKRKITRFFQRLHERNLLFNPRGRATRREFMLLTFFAFVCLVISVSPGIDTPALIAAFLSVGIFIAVSIRRLHDSGQSAWVMLSLAIPYIGLGWFLFSVFASPHDHTNEHGLNPRFEPDQD